MKTKTKPRKFSPLPTALAALALALALLLALAPAALALDWDRTDIEQHASIGNPLPPYVFTCTNTGSTTITITELHPSCGCLTPVLAKKILAPGETAQLTIGFDRAGYIGDTVRTIGIVTDEPGRDRQPYQLTLRADLPAALTIAPRLLVWKTKERAKAKSADIKINLPDPVEITAATSASDDMTVKLVTLEKGRHYRLDIKPRSTSKPLSPVVITLQTTTPLPADTALTLYAQVR